jgi:hypothetical protein
MRSVRSGPSGPAHRARGGGPLHTPGRAVARIVEAVWRVPSASRSIPTSTARSVRSFSQSISSLSERPALGIGPELTDPLDSVEVGEAEDVDKFGASGWR